MIVARLFQNIASGITRRPSLPDSAAGASARSSAGVLAASETRRRPIREAAISALGISETERIGRICQNGDSLGAGECLLEQLQPLVAQTGEHLCASHITARPRKALRQPKRNG